jgi:hypothetical protein
LLLPGRTSRHPALHPRVVRSLVMLLVGLHVQLLLVGQHLLLVHLQASPVSLGSCRRRPNIQGADRAHVGGEGTHLLLVELLLVVHLVLDHLRLYMRTPTAASPTTASAAAAAPAAAAPAPTAAAMRKSATAASPLWRPTPRPHLGLGRRWPLLVPHRGCTRARGSYLASGVYLGVSEGARTGDGDASGGQMVRPRRLHTHRAAASTSLHTKATRVPSPHTHAGGEHSPPQPGHGASRLPSTHPAQMCVGVLGGTGGGLTWLQQD